MKPVSFTITSQIESQFSAKMADKDSPWTISPTKVAAANFIPVRKLMEQSPNPDKSVIYLSLGDPTGYVDPPTVLTTALKSALESGEHHGRILFCRH